MVSAPVVGVVEPALRLLVLLERSRSDVLDNDTALVAPALRRGRCPLAGVNLSDYGAVRQALDAFERPRKPHTAKQVQLAYALGKVFHHAATRNC
jgi:hypothetical protein